MTNLLTLLLQRSILLIQRVRSIQVMNDELKGIFLQRNTCYVVRIRRKGVNPYSRTFYFEHDKDGIKKSEALQDAIAWRQQELASVARDGLESVGTRT